MSVDATRTTLPIWSIDSSLSRARFTAHHVMFGRVTGLLGPVSGTLRFDPEDFTMDFLEIFIDVVPLHTGHERRDNDLCAAGFFDVEHYPTVWFRSTRALLVQAGAYLVRGELTLKGIVGSVRLFVTYQSQFADPSGAGSVRASFMAEMTVSCKEFAMVGARPQETGGAVAADTLNAVISVEAVRQC